MKNDLRKPNVCKIKVPILRLVASDSERMYNVWLHPDDYSDKEVFKLCGWFTRLALTRVADKYEDEDVKLLKHDQEKLANKNNRLKTNVLNPKTRPVK